MNEKKVKPVIALVTIGTVHPDGLGTLETIDSLICDHFPGYDIRWGFQSKFTIDTFYERGVTTVFDRKVPLISAAGLLAELAKEGVTKVVMQMVMVTEGSLFCSATEADTHGINVKYGLPFLSHRENIALVVKRLSSNFGDGVETATVLTAHNVKEDFRYNDCFIEIDNIVRKNYRNVFVATLNGPPGIEGVIADVKRSCCKKMRFISLMLIAKAHYKDIMGDGPKSWKSRIGLPVEVIDSFYENSGIKDYFVNNIRALMEQFEQSS
ncbi:MAG: hypothetical protein C4555_07680 [Dehalococcoidia bacterium]|jgi:cobalamin biosynthesis Co2+ chelatase CbiK|nr:MAG: hypothetical protein C4555_07680 [Dehalococcoidia bacterium]